LMTGVGCISGSIEDHLQRQTRKKRSIVRSVVIVDRNSKLKPGGDSAVDWCMGYR
jgi:hypothetical protein